METKVRSLQQTQGGSERPTDEGRVFVCAVRDAGSNRLVGYAVGERMTARLAIAVLELAVVRRGPMGTVVAHSDCGSSTALGRTGPPSTVRA